MSRQPVLFISHGAPTFALEPGRAGALLHALGERLLKPKAVLIVSPHWITHDIAVTANPQPATIHDFGGFPAELYTLQYPVSGQPGLAGRIASLLREAGYTTTLEERRGLDHGAWVPLRHLYPEGEVPVVQVSMPEWLDTESAWKLGEALAPLADEGVLIIGSGSLTHNLYEFRQQHGEEADYVHEFVLWARQAIQSHDRDALVDYLQKAPQARRAHPSPDHYLPLLVAAGAGGVDARVEVLDGGVAHGVLSMESYLFESR